ncbi:anti-sigma factor [Synoicihabitans lomoniglobus]|uniref:Uncharacterized protein n=1 Tax=Synoicihabitans lomoniglobus TaxID=2909285 RepID=A0AAE9ZSU8_9BACT|nr:hypothetical protein [Opitutaceae bacterium LMO-M01]WED63631.1 hypothetical protein PXH66_14940 [Opitutaceae bacterium LMO-M01]
MNKDLETTALHYLLDELDPTERTAFEHRLANDPAAAAMLKSCSAALTHFARQEAPAETLPAAAQRDTLQHILGTIAAEPPRRSRRSTLLRRWAWPLAACLLLGLNLVQLSSPDSRISDGPQTAASPATGSSTASTPEPTSATAAVIGGQETTIDQLDLGTLIAALTEGYADGAEPPIIQELRRLKSIRLQYGKLQEDHEALREQHLAVIQQIAQLALVDQGVGRLAAMELVDPTSYELGQRKGLLDLALDLLTEPGIVALEPQTPDPEFPDGEEPNVASPDEPANEVPDPTDPATPDDGTGDPTNVTPEDPYAWSVFDESNHRGYLNLYNLPFPAAETSLQLWVKPSATSPYQRVGEVPSQFYGGDGSLFYTLPGATQPPTEILITQEPVGSEPPQPTGPTVLRGP